MLGSHEGHGAKGDAARTSGIDGKICDTLNEIISLNERMMQEFTKAGNTIGKKGKLTERIEAPSVRGAWKNGLISDCGSFAAAWAAVEGLSLRGARRRRNLGGGHAGCW